MVDTNVLVSRLILPDSMCAQVLRRAEFAAKLLISEATMSELVDVLSRPKFNRYASVRDRRGFIERLTQIAELVAIIQSVRECRDPADDKFLNWR